MASGYFIWLIGLRQGLSAVRQRISEGEVLCHYLLPMREWTLPMRVLVVEDEKKISQLVRKGLRENGFVVDVLGNGDEALEAMLSTPFDAVVMDVMLPGRDGLSVLRQAREKGCRVPVLLLTARGAVNERI